MKWFGQPWGAPLCEAAEQMGTPIGDPCLRCKVEIVAGDQGVILPLVIEDGTATLVAMHLDCLVRSVVPDEIAVAKTLIQNSNFVTSSRDSQKKIVSTATIGDAIRRLKTEAASDNDLTTVALCQLALDGEAAALDRVIEILRKRSVQ